MNGGEKEEESRAAVDATIVKRKGKGRKSAAAIVEALSEAPLPLEPGNPGENADCDLWSFKTVVGKEKEEEEDVGKGSFEAMAQPEFVIGSGPLPANDPTNDGLEKPPRTINENNSSIWHALSTWWTKYKRKKHTINWANIEIDVCPPPDFMEEPWQSSSPDFIEEPCEAFPPEHHEPEFEAPPSPIPLVDYSSSGWFTLATWWRKEKRAKRTLTWADIDACPPPGYTEESGMFWPPENESDDGGIDGILETEARGRSGRNGS